MKNIKLGSGIVIITLLFVCLFLLKGCYISHSNGYTLEIDSMDKGIKYQIFYTTENEPNFSEENSVKFETTGNTTAFLHYEVYLPMSEKIKDFRIDFGSVPETIKIKNVNILGKTETNIPVEDIVSGFSGDVESYLIEDDYLQINSNNSDPYSILPVEISLPYQETNINYSDLIDVCLLYFMSVWIVFYMFKKVSTKKSKKYRT